MPSAKTVAQKPAGNFNPAAVLGHPLPAAFELALAELAFATGWDAF
jgi:hypothetical protein